MGCAHRTLSIGRMLCLKDGGILLHYRQENHSAVPVPRQKPFPQLNSSIWFSFSVIPVF